MNETIVIHNVDVELLEEQRLALVRVTSAVSTSPPGAVDFEDVALLDGLQNMLDEWSDKHWLDREISSAPEPPTNRKS